MHITYFPTRVHMNWSHFKTIGVSAASCVRTKVCFVFEQKCVYESSTVLMRHISRHVGLHFDVCRNYSLLAADLHDKAIKLKEAQYLYKKERDKYWVKYLLIHEVC
jgi:hypothetical protein